MSQEKSEATKKFLEDLSFVMERHYCYGVPIASLVVEYGVYHHVYGNATKILKEDGQWDSSIKELLYTNNVTPISRLKEADFNRPLVLMQHRKESMMMLPWTAWEIVAASLPEDVLKEVLAYESYEEEKK